VLVGKNIILRTDIKRRTIWGAIGVTAVKANSLDVFKKLVSTAYNVIRIIYNEQLVPSRTNRIEVCKVGESNSLKKSRLGAKIGQLPSNICVEIVVSR